MSREMMEQREQSNACINSAESRKNKSEAQMRHSGIEWIGEIPKEWKTCRLKGIAHSLTKGNGITKEEVFPDGDTPCVRYGEIYSKYNGAFIECKSKTRKDILSSTRYFNFGDILFAGTGELVEEIGKNIVYVGVTSCLAGGDIIILKHSQNPVFLNYALNSQYAQSQKSCGKAKLKVVHISSSEIGDLQVILPPLSEQQKIANYLDKVCSEVDELIALQEQMIEELKAYKQSVITEAVTKGLNPDVPMKDSGIDWIGEVPEHWDTRRIGNLFKLRDEKNYKPMDEVQLLSLYTGIGVFPHGEQEERGNKAITVEGYKVVHKDDIVVNIILAWMGAIGVSNYDGVTSPAYDVYIPDLSKVVPHFFHYVFRTQGIAGECYKYGRGIMMMRWRTYSSEFKQIRVPFPSLEEQQSIASYLDTKCAEIDALIAIKQSKMEELKEYKKSVIYEYVTGKKEVV